MNTSGVDEPPEISVASVARLVSVSVGAETSVTLMSGYCFSKALISTARASFAPVPDSGLADQTTLPEVAEVATLAAGEIAPVLLPPPLLHADAASTAAPAAAASARPPLRAFLRDISAPPWSRSPDAGASERRGSPLWRGAVLLRPIAPVKLNYQLTTTYPEDC